MIVMIMMETPRHERLRSKRNHQSDNTGESLLAFGHGSASRFFEDNCYSREAVLSREAIIMIAARDMTVVVEKRVQLPGYFRVSY
jgi:hypothetical protein